MTHTKTAKQKSPHAAGFGWQSTGSSKECNEALQAGFLNQVIIPARTAQDHVAGADQQGLNSGIVFGFDLLKMAVEFCKRHLPIQGVFAQIGVALGGHFVRGDLVRGVNCLVKRGDQSQHQASATCHLRHGCQPATERCAASKAANDARNQSEPSPHTHMQHMTGGVALGIKPRFVKGSFVSSRFGCLHGAPSSVVASAAPDCVEAMEPGFGVQGSQSFFKSYGGLLALPIVTRECRRTRHDHRESPALINANWSQP